MNKCIPIYELIHKELDGDLSSGELLLLDEHCNICLHCQGLRQEFLDIENGLFSLPLIDPGEGFSRQIMTTLEKATTKKDFNFSNFTSLVAAITLLLTSGIVFMGWFLIIPFLGLSIYLFNEYWPFSYLGEALEIFSSVLNSSSALVDTTIQIVTPSLLGTIIFVSFASFIILLKLMLINKEDYQYE